MNKNKIYDAVIIGGGLTGLTIGYYLNKAGLKIRLLEKLDRAGGVIHTESENGFVYETGPNSGVLGTPEAAELFEDLSGKCTLETAKPESKKRLIWKDSKWNQLPSDPISAFNTPLFKFRDKLGILAEPLRKKVTDPEESVASMVRRRLGESFLQYAVDPFIAGIYAGNPDNLITKYALPKLFNLEQKYGSFIKGALKKRKEVKSPRDKKATKEVFSAEGGLKNLIDALTGSIGKSIELSCNDITINREDSHYNINYINDGNDVEIKSKVVITTSGAYSLSKMFPDIDREILRPVTKLKYAKVVQAILGYTIWEGMDLQAFGGLIPSAEKRKVLGVLFMSSIFRERAPENGALMSFFMGGERNPEMFDLKDEEIKTIVLQEAEELLKTSNLPDLIKIFRYRAAIPQYDITSKERLEKIDEIQKEYPGLILAGNIRDGIGMADRIAQAKNIADDIIKKI